MISLREDEKTGIIYRQWASSLPQKMALLLVHGLGAHSGRWQFLADFLLNKGISSYALELKGFGGTRDLHGHIDSFDIYFNDILHLCNIIRRENPGAKILLAGESLGAVIAYLMALKAPGPFGGLICLSPAIRATLPFSFFDYLRIILTFIFSPRKPLEMPFSSEGITRDKDYQDEMDTSGLEHRVATPKMLLNIGLAQLRLVFLRNNIHLPLLFLVAGDDRLVDANSSKRFFRSLKISDKELIEYPGMYHSMIVDYGKEKVFEDIYSWIVRKISIPQSARRF